MPADEVDRGSKVPGVTLIFWLIKIVATTLGETAGDALSMSLGLGYLVSTVIFAGLFAIAVSAQLAARQFRPLLYWATIVATTTVGTTLADFADRSLGIGYAGGSAALLALLLSSLIVWHRSLGTIAVENISTRKAEWFYWITIVFSQTLGTALGDWTADTAGLGYTGAMVIFSGLLLTALAAYLWTTMSRTALFWLAFVISRPLGAVVGDFLDKPIDDGGLAFSREGASFALAGVMLALILLSPHRQAKSTH